MDLWISKNSCQLKMKKNEFDSSKTDSKDEIFFIFDPKREVEVGRSGKEQK